MYRVLLLTFIVIATPLFGDVDGKYQVSGFDPYDNTRYTGTADIKQSGQLYHISWNITPPGIVYKGTGIKIGNSISFVFEILRNGKSETGIQTYAINGNTLAGEWAYLGKDWKGTETLRKIPAN